MLDLPLELHYTWYLTHHLRLVHCVQTQHFYMRSPRSFTTSRKFRLSKPFMKESLPIGRSTANENCCGGRKGTPRILVGIPHLAWWSVKPCIRTYSTHTRSGSLHPPTVSPFPVLRCTIIHHYSRCCMVDRVPKLSRKYEPSPPDVLDFHVSVRIKTKLYTPGAKRVRDHLTISTKTEKHQLPDSVYSTTEHTTAPLLSLSRGPQYL